MVSGTNSSKKSTTETTWPILQLKADHSSSIDLSLEYICQFCSIPFIPENKSFSQKYYLLEKLNKNQRIF